MNGRKDCLKILVLKFIMKWRSCRTMSERHVIENIGTVSGIFDMFE